MLLKRLFILLFVALGIQSAQADGCDARYFYLTHPAKLQLKESGNRSVASTGAILWEPTVMRRWQLINPFKINFLYHSSVFYQSPAEQKASEAEIQSFSDSDNIVNCFE